LQESSEVTLADQLGIRVRVVANLGKKTPARAVQ
jgi:hypothetical protein